MMTTLQETLARSRDYTLQVAEAMPSSAYDQRPSEDVFTFRELIHHIAYGIHWWTAQFIERQETAWAPPATGKDKKAVVAYLREAFTGLEKAAAGKLDAAATYGVHATLDHVTHHRGAATIYLRSQGITPPEYTY
jgi:uncharacterized damage-inducible protein DinB